MLLTDYMIRIITFDMCEYDGSCMYILDSLIIQIKHIFLSIHM